MAKELKNILVNLIHDRQLRVYSGKYFSGQLIDIGCGIKPYRTMLQGLVTGHVGVDHQSSFHDNSNVDIYGTAYDIPVDDDAFDCVLCTAVLEHLEEPDLALRECYRILKPGGVAIYSVPFIWHLHEEPRDFFRYSKYGLSYLFEKNNFEILEIKPLSGFWVTFGQLFVYQLYRCRKSLLKYTGLIELLGLLVQFFAYGLDRLDSSNEWTWMYMAVVRKPVSKACEANSNASNNEVSHV